MTLSKKKYATVKINTNYFRSINYLFIRLSLDGASKAYAVLYIV